jgi:DNA-binding CsgD family transcriptional regulator/uncharacterized protein YciI
VAMFLLELTFARTSDRFDQLRPAHRAYWEQMASEGVLIDGGLFVDGAGGVLLCKARCRSELREVVLADPFVGAGMVSRFEIREWIAVLGRAPAQPNPKAELPGFTMADRSRPSVPRIESKPPGARTRPFSQFKELTPHEQRIANLMLLGKTNREIAGLFSVSPRAVELHITSMYRKLGISRRAQLAGALGEAA